MFLHYFFFLICVKQRMTKTIIKVNWLKNYLYKF